MVDEKVVDELERYARRMERAKMPRWELVLALIEERRLIRGVVMEVIELLGACNWQETTGR